MTPLELFASGTVIPAHPLALTADRKLDERRQKAVGRYYAAAGAGGMAVGVHTTQFPIHDNGMLRPVLEIAMEAAREANRPLAMVAGVQGDRVRRFLGALDGHVGRRVDVGEDDAMGAEVDARRHADRALVLDDEAHMDRAACDGAAGEGRRCGKNRGTGKDRGGIAGRSHGLSLHYPADQEAPMAPLGGSALQDTSCIFAAFCHE